MARIRTILSYAIAALIPAVASGSLLAQSRTVPKQFDHVRSLGRAASEFKDDRLQIVVSYAESQVNHDSRWLLIELGAFSRSTVTIERSRIELVTPDGSVVAHATPDRFQEASDITAPRLRRPSSAPRLAWYLPYDGLAANGWSYSWREPRISLAPLDVAPRFGPAFTALPFESPTGAWDAGLYALIVPYDGSEAILPIALR